MKKHIYNLGPTIDTTNVCVLFYGQMATDIQVVADPTGKRHLLFDTATRSFCLIQIRYLGATAEDTADCRECLKAEELMRLYGGLPKANCIGITRWGQKCDGTAREGKQTCPHHWSQEPVGELAAAV